ncbi:hypothetical protein ACFSWE_07690 [Leucobacter albus]|uniref:Uncharacterized protein n=1 Tax=Leucobacter albus TaxID=272210 RepID=A0ABW3TLJ0_9MICO
MSPTDEPLTDSAAAFTELRSLARSTMKLENPAQSYQIIGELLGGVRALEQVLQQIATAHTAHEQQANTDYGDRVAGIQAARAAALELRAAAVLIGQAESRLDAASQHSGRIAWQPQDAERPASPRWVNIVFLEGQDADRMLALLERAGTDAVITELSGYDFGDESTQAALVNGYIYDEVPTGALDRVTTHGDYTLTYNHDLGHVSLHRALPHTATAPAQAPEQSTPARSQARRNPHALDPDEDNWATSAPFSTSPRMGRAL